MSSKIEFDDDAIRRLQAQANATGQAVVREVGGRMVGRPVPEVMDALGAGMRAARLEPSDAGLLPLAESISAGTLTE